MTKYLNHEEAKFLINHAKRTRTSEWLSGWDLGRRYGRFCEQQDIIKLLEEQDWLLAKKMAETPSGWRVHELAGQRKAFHDAIALIKGKK